MDRFKKSIIKASIVLTLIICSVSTVLTRPLPDELLQSIIEKGLHTRLNAALRGTLQDRRGEAFNQLAPDKTFEWKNWVWQNGVPRAAKIRRNIGNTNYGQYRYYSPRRAQDSLINNILLFGPKNSQTKRELITTILDFFARPANRIDDNTGRNFTPQQFNVLLNTKKRNAYNDNTKTAIMLAIHQAEKEKTNQADFNNYKEIIQKLVDQGANLLLQSRRGKNPVTLYGALEIDKLGPHFNWRGTQKDLIDFLTLSLLFGPQNRNDAIIPTSYNRTKAIEAIKTILHYAITQNKPNRFVGILDYMHHHLAQFGGLQNINTQIINWPDPATKRDLLRSIIRSTQGSHEYGEGAARINPNAAAGMVTALLKNFTVDLTKPDKFNTNALYWAIRGLQPEILKAIIKNAKDNDKLFEALTTKYGGVRGHNYEKPFRPIQLAVDLLRPATYRRDVKRHNWNNQSETQKKTLVTNTLKVLIDFGNNGLLHKLQEKVEASTMKLKRLTTRGYRAAEQQIATMHFPDKQLLEEIKAPLKIMQELPQRYTLILRALETLISALVGEYEQESTRMEGEREKMGLIRESIKEIIDQMPILKRKIRKLGILTLHKLHAAVTQTGAQLEGAIESIDSNISFITQRRRTEGGLEALTAQLSENLGQDKIFLQELQGRLILNYRFMVNSLEQLINTYTVEYEQESIQMDAIRSTIDLIRNTLDEIVTDTPKLRRKIDELERLLPRSRRRNNQQPQPTVTY